MPPPSPAGSSIPGADTSADTRIDLNAPPTMTTTGGGASDDQCGMIAHDADGDNNNDPWAGFKIGTLLIDGVPHGAVHVSGCGVFKKKMKGGGSTDGGGTDGDRGGEGQDYGGETGVDVVAYYPHFVGGSGGEVERRSGEGRVFEVALRAVREVGVCNQEIVRYTGGGSVSLRKMDRGVVYVVGDEKWAVDGDGGDGKDGKDGAGGGAGGGEGREVVRVENVAVLCRMCDRHVVEQRESVALTLRLEGAVKKQIRHMVHSADLKQRQQQQVQQSPLRPRFWSTHVVAIIGRQDFEAILGGGLMLRLKRRFDVKRFVSSLFVSIGVVLLTFGLAAIALLFYLIRNARSKTRNDFVSKVFKTNFCYAEASLVGRDTPWVESQLLADDNSLVEDTEWPSQDTSSNKLFHQKGGTTKRISTLPQDGVLLRGEGRAVTVTFRSNRKCSACANKKYVMDQHWIDRKMSKNEIEIEPLFDIVVLESTADGALKVVKLRDTCLKCLRVLYTEKGASWFFGADDHDRKQTASCSLSRQRRVQVLGLVGNVGRRQQFVSCGRPEDGVVDYALEILPQAASVDSNEWQSIALHEGAWTGCGASPQRIVVN